MLLQPYTDPEAHSSKQPCRPAHRRSTIQKNIQACSYYSFVLFRAAYRLILIQWRTVTSSRGGLLSAAAPSRRISRLAAITLPHPYYYVLCCFSLILIQRHTLVGSRVGLPTAVVPSRRISRHVTIIILFYFELLPALY